MVTRTGSPRAPILLALGLLALGGLIYWALGPSDDTYQVERTEYKPPAENPQELLVDDRLEDKKPPAFDPALVDRRPLDGWLINASAAILQLDCPLIKPDQDADLLILHPSYKAALSGQVSRLLPSVNMVDGKAKQFDDGLYAALDQAYYQGLKDRLLSHAELIRRMYNALPRESPAAPYLAAGLELAEVDVDVRDRPAKDKLLKEFQEAEIMSKPIGFYTWNPTLSACFRFMRFFQQEFGDDELAAPRALAQTLAKD
ncbi:MAG TPA: hypothetical protein VGY58_18280 [Gemmataceae bacterium]|nr:hypothetical protein [Gemmataceae bacterium]